MNIWHDIDPSRIKPNDFYAIIEIPSGSKNKYEMDKETGLLKLDRVLYTSTHYPANYGFIPRTFAEDDDPLAPMTLVRCYPIGVIKMSDNGKADEKIIAVPYTDPTYNGYRSIFALPKHTYDEMKHFFSVYKTLEKKETVMDEVGDENEASRIVSECIERYSKCFKDGKQVKKLF